MSRPLVSVVIPCHNRAGLCRRAVESVLRQSHASLEVIVVDDASDDGDELATSMNGFGDSRIRLLRHFSNMGGAAARNTGVAVATGEFIAFLDSDDEWLQAKVETQIARAKALGGGDWLVYTQSEVITTQASGPHRSIMPLHPIASNETIGDYLFAGRGWIPTPSMLLPRHLALRVPFNPVLRRHQDYDFLLRLEALGCRFEMVPEPLVIVHWEDLHQTARGLNPSQSLAFLQEYRGFLSPKAQSGFVNGQIVMRLLAGRRRIEAFQNLFRHVRPWHLSLVQHVSVLSGLIFGDARFARWLACLKRAWANRRLNCCNSDLQ